MRLEQKNKSKSQQTKMTVFVFDNSHISLDSAKKNYFVKQNERTVKQLLASRN